MRASEVEAAKAEAQRFVAKCNLLLRLEYSSWETVGCPESGAVRRASMDLTRALARPRARPA